MDYTFLTLLADTYLESHFQTIRRQGKDLLRLRDNEKPTVYIDYVTERLLVVDRSALSQLAPRELPPYYLWDTMPTSARALLGIRVGAQMGLSESCDRSVHLNLRCNKDLFAWMASAKGTFHSCRSTRSIHCTDGHVYVVQVDEYSCRIAELLPGSL